MDRFYVYALLDPRKPGEYKYSDIEFEYEPFYIGKGQGNRRIQHFTPHSLNRNDRKSTKIKAIRNAELQPINRIVFDNLLESDALLKEVELIDLIGRLDIKTGVLTNMTNGGDGVSGYIASEALRIVRSNNSSGNKNAFYGKTHNVESFKSVYRPVYKINKDTDEIIDEYTSIADAARKNNFSANHIGECCRGNRAFHMGFRWKFVNDESPTIRNWKPGRSHKVLILQIDPETDKVIKEWESIAKATKELNLSAKAISKVLNGSNRLGGGFKWKYKD